MMNVPVYKNGDVQGRVVDFFFFFFLSVQKKLMLAHFFLTVGQEIGNITLFRPNV